MSYATTYDSLLEDLRRYLERGFTEQSDEIVWTQLPRLITLAERRIATEGKFLGFIRAVTMNFQIGVATYQKPELWRDTVSVRTTGANGAAILARSFEYIRNYWPDTSATAPVEFYADYNYTHWLFGPTPDTTAEVEILYYEQPQFLTEANQTNWLTQYAPQLLLYGALLEATPFLKNDSRIPVWQAAFDRAMQAMSTQDSERITDRTAVRSEP